MRYVTEPEGRMKTSLVAIAVCATLAAAVPAVGAAAKVPLPGFHSPSGNIRCLFVPGSRGPSGSSPSVLHCSIAAASYAQALQERCIAGPSVDWHGFELAAAGRGRVTCSGGILYSPATQRPTYVDLAYGRTWRQGAFTCVSRTTGVTCRNRAGHGLFVSRGSWRAW